MVLLPAGPSTAGGLLAPSSRSLRPSLHPPGIPLRPVGCRAALCPCRPGKTTYPLSPRIPDATLDSIAPPPSARSRRVPARPDTPADPRPSPGPCCAGNAARRAERRLCLTPRRFDPSRAGGAKARWLFAFGAKAPAAWPLGAPLAARYARGKAARAALIPAAAAFACSKGGRGVTLVSV